MNELANDEITAVPDDEEEGEEATAVESEEAEEEELSAEDLEVASQLYKQATGEAEFPKGKQFPHAGNIAKKIKDHKGKGTVLSNTIEAIFKEYTSWRTSTFAAKGTKSEVIAAKVSAFDKYSSFLDTPPVDAFDSRGALVSSALEEFCYYLLKPILDGFPKALLGKQDTYQGLYFTAANFEQLLKLPTAHLPVNTLDFIIGSQVEGVVKADGESEEFPIRIPAVAVECKGYIDRPRYIESQNMARAIKAAFPQCLYILVAQCDKLNLKKIGPAPEIDGIYVWRRMSNIDRKVRRKKGISLKPLHTPAVEHFYDRIHQHLSGNWQMADPRGTGILK